MRITFCLKNFRKFVIIKYETVLSNKALKMIVHFLQSFQQHNISQIDCHPQVTDSPIHVRYVQLSDILFLFILLMELGSSGQLLTKVFLTPDFFKGIMHEIQSQIQLLF